MSEKLTRSDVILICEKLAEDAIDEQNIEKAQGVTTVETDIISHMTTGKQQNKHCYLSCISH